MTEIEDALAKLRNVGLFSEAHSETEILGGRSFEMINLGGLEAKLRHDSFSIRWQDATWTAITEGPGNYFTLIQAKGTLEHAVAVVCRFYTAADPTDSVHDIDGQEAVRLLVNCGLLAELLAFPSKEEIFGGTQVIGEGRFRDYQNLFAIYKPYGSWVASVRMAGDLVLVSISATLNESVEAICSYFARTGSVRHTDTPIP